MRRLTFREKPNTCPPVVRLCWESLINVSSCCLQVDFDVTRPDRRSHPRLFVRHRRVFLFTFRATKQKAHILLQEAGSLLQNLDYLIFIFHHADQRPTLRGVVSFFILLLTARTSLHLFFHLQIRWSYWHAEVIFCATHTSTTAFLVQ